MTTRGESGSYISPLFDITQMALLKRKNNKGLLSQYPRRPLLQALQSRRGYGTLRPIQPTVIVRRRPALTTREFLILVGLGVMGTGGLFMASANPVDKGIGIFVFVLGLLTLLSSNFKGARKDIQKAFKTFMCK